MKEHVKLSLKTSDGQLPDLLTLATLLKEFHSVVDTTYATVAGLKRVSAKDRESYRIETNELLKGSLIADLAIVVNAAQLTLPLVGVPELTRVWHYVADGFKLITALAESRRRNETIEIQGNENIVIVYGDSNKIETYDPWTVMAARRNQRHWEAIARHVSEDQVNEFRVDGQETKRDAVINLNNRDLYQTHSELVPEIVNLSVNILSFNKEINTGYLRVDSDQSIPVGKYSFSVIGHQSRRSYIESMLVDQVQVAALLEYVVDPVQGRIIKRIQIVQIRAR